MAKMDSEDDCSPRNATARLSILLAELPDSRILEQGAASLELTERPMDEVRFATVAK
jgi:hypothetical protein